MDKFFELVVNQFKYGGKKYAHSGKKEATDCLFDDFGKNWLFGTIAKYCKRYSNLARERDLLKIATYMFIVWLKRGFHIELNGTIQPINTTVAVKSKFLPVFREKLIEFDSGYNYSGTDPMGKIYELLVSFGKMPFHKIPETRLFQVFVLAQRIWNKDIDNKGGDQDVNNEETVTTKKGTVVSAGKTKPKVEEKVETKKETPSPSVSEVKVEDVQGGRITPKDIEKPVEEPTKTEETEKDANNE